VIDDEIRKKKEKMLYKSVGYHHFNMYAFAILKQSIPNHPFWKSTQFSRSVNYLISDEFKNSLLNNIYGYSYNPPGFEIPYALSILTNKNNKDLLKLSSWWVNEQFRKCYNIKTKMMDRNTDDPLTHTARIYEIARLPVITLKAIKVQY
jgi:hypothetical protein